MKFTHTKKSCFHILIILVALSVMMIASEKVNANTSCTHSWSAVGTKAPTEKKTGIRIHTCTICKKKETSSISKLPKVRLNRSYLVFEKSKTSSEKCSVSLKLLGTSKKVKWSSTNKKLVNVNSKGELTLAKNKVGTAKIIAKLNNKKYVCVIKVVDVPSTGSAKNPLKIFEGLGDGEFENISGPAHFAIHGHGHFVIGGGLAKGNRIHGWYYNRTTKSKFECSYLVVGNHIYVTPYDNPHNKNILGSPEFEIVSSSPDEVKIKSLNDIYYDKGTTYTLVKERIF